MFGDAETYGTTGENYGVHSFAVSLLPMKAGVIAFLLMIFSVFYLDLWKEFFFGMGMHTLHYAVRPYEVNAFGPMDVYLSVGAGAMTRGHWGFMIMPVIAAFAQQWQIWGGTGKNMPMANRATNSLIAGAFVGASIATGTQAARL